MKYHLQQYADTGTTDHSNSQNQTKSNIMIPLYSQNQKNDINYL